jgi:hypothetical protein
MSTYIYFLKIIKIWVIIVNLYDHPPLLSSPYNFQTKGRDIYSPPPYSNFKTSKQGEGVIIPLPSTLLPSLTIYPHLPPNFQT